MPLLPFMSHLNEIEYKQLFYTMEITCNSYWQILGKTISKLVFAFKILKEKQMFLCWACCLVKGKTSIQVPVQNQAINDLFVVSGQDQHLPVLWNMLGQVSHCLICYTDIQLYTEHLHLGALATGKFLFQLGFIFIILKKINK